MGLIKKAIIAGAVYSILKGKKKTDEPDISQKKEELKTEIQIPKTELKESKGEIIPFLFVGGLLFFLILLLLINSIKSRKK